MWAIYPSLHFYHKRGVLAWDIIDTLLQSFMTVDHCETLLVFCLPGLKPLGCVCVYVREHVQHSFERSLYNIVSNLYIYPRV